jgi:hypothetical protein
MNMRQIKITILGVLAACALLALPAVGSAAKQPAPVITAAGIKVKACTSKDTAPLVIFVRGVDCGQALDLANLATSADYPCPEGWNFRNVQLKARVRGKQVPGPMVFLCSRNSGRNAFTYHPLNG